VKTAVALSLILLLALLFLARRPLPLLRGYLAVRDALTDAPLSEPEAWVYRRIEE